MALTTDKKRFTFTDQDGEIAASCTLHSADIGAYQRCMKVMEYFQGNPAAETTLPKCLQRERTSCKAMLQDMKQR